MTILMNTAGKSQGYHAPIIYGGTRFDVALMQEESLIYLADFPFSFIMDTVLLPVTIPWAIIASMPGEEPVETRPVPEHLDPDKKKEGDSEET